ncbi:MAG: hypothetical protein WBA93_23510 [Microcoleaceae cyanobacterium]
MEEKNWPQSRTFLTLVLYQELKPDRHHHKLPLLATYDSLELIKYILFKF